MMILNETITFKRPKGLIHLNYYKEGVLQFEHEQANMVVNNGLLVMAGLIASKYTSYQVTKFGIGDGVVPVAAGDTQLSGANFLIKSLDLINTNVYGSSSARLAFSVDFNTDIAGQNMGSTNPWPAVNTYAIKEFALFSANNTMFNRLIWSGPALDLSLGISISGFFQIDILTL